jgi:eukaryotic-like serine/threonine-protein kinase
MSVPNERLAEGLTERYRIERELGAGGMATVYLAEDVRHRRKVALKLLHPELSAVLGPERFLKEIELTASLQHPHILPLFDSGSADGQLFYVMPFIDGETLRARLERERQLPIADAVRLATEVADALSYAHGRGVVHRDIKPENVLLQGGHALVADFGIALAVQQAGGQRMTQTGLSLGTPQYMSPEQAMGEKTLDARTDIYALGAVTYEMLTGEPPFSGPTVQSIVAKVLTERPMTPTAVRDTIPAGVEHAVLTALAKLPADRFASAADFATALKSEAPVTTPRTRAVSGDPRRERPNAVLTALGITTLAVAVAAWALATRSTGASMSPVGIFDAVLPDSAAMSHVASVSATGFGTSISHLSVSPAGDFVVYPAQRGDSTVLWSRSLVDGSAHAIAGTAGGAVPRISPDGRHIAFVAGTRTLVVPVAGGDPRRLMDGDSPASLEWVSPTRLLALGNDGYGLKWIDPEVGVVEEPRIANAGRCVFGQWIPEDRQLLCSFFETATILDPATGEMHPIRTRAPDGSPGAPVSGSAFRLVDGAYMMYVSLDGNLRASSYDRRARVLGRSVTLATGVSRDALGAAQLDLSPSGLLGFAPMSGGADARLVVARDGVAPVPLPIEPAAFLRFDLSPDRRQLAAVVAVSEGEELRFYDLRTGRRQTWMRGSRINMPLWSPSGDRVIVRVENGSGAALLLGSPHATSAPDTIMSSDTARLVHDALDFFDDRTILARDARVAGVYRIDISARPAKVDTLFTDAYFTTVSPDRKHIAWQNAITNQVFVGAYPPGAKRQQVASGAVEPVWMSPTELVYRSNVTWYKVRIDGASGEPTGAPTLWARDTRFLDTPGWSNRSSRDGGLIYSRAMAQADVRFLRFIPDFVRRMKQAVNEANR